MILVKGGRLNNAAMGGSADVLIKDGKIAAISENIQETKEMAVINAAGMIIAPGLVDMHVHFREPGFEYKEDILTGAAAAAAGGVTTCCCMANTNPVADNADVLSYIAGRASQAAVRVLQIGAVTIGQQGRELTDFAALKAAGAVALSDDGNPIQDEALMRRALLRARERGLVIITHCEDAELVRDYAVNEGMVSRQLGIPGRPAEAETRMVERDAALAAETGCKVHIAHVSAAGAVEAIRKAKAAGAPVTAETCPQYFSLIEDEVPRRGALARVNPPLRTAEDVAAVIEGLADGTIDAIATDHAPHSAAEKALPLQKAPSGMVGLETSLAVTLTFLYHTGKLGLERVIELMSAGPARLLGLDAGALSVGAAADIVVFDPEERWVVDPCMFKSKGRNTPFAGMELRWKVKFTISRGKVV